MNPLAILLAGLLLICNEGVFAQSSQQLFNDAQRAYLAGDVAGAKQRFITVLQQDPTNTAAKNYLRMIVTQEKTEGGSQMENQLKALVLPKVELHEATFGVALDYLKQQAAKQSQGKTNVSFVVQLPTEFTETQRVTLNLSAIPFTEALRYLCDLAGVEYRVDKYAITVKKKSADSPSPKSSP